MKASNGLPLITKKAFCDLFTNPLYSSSVDEMPREELIEHISNSLGFKLLLGEQHVLVAECQRLQAMDKLMMHCLVKLTESVRFIHSAAPTLNTSGGFLVGALVMYRLLEAAGKSDSVDTATRETTEDRGRKKGKTNGRKERK